MSTKFFPLDLSKFKRVSSDKNTTTLRHEHGHEVKIAHNALSPKLRGNLAALPQHKESNSKVSNKTEMMAQGGEVKQDYEAEAKIADAEGDTKRAAILRTGQMPPSPTPSPQPQMASGGEVEQSNPKLEESKKTPSSPEPITEEDPNYSDPVLTKTAKPRLLAEGTPNGTLDPMDVTPAGAPQGATPMDPEVAAKRDLYNQQVNGNFSPKPTIVNQPQSFGPNGEAPQDFNADAWKTAEDRYSQMQATKQETDSHAQKTAAWDAAEQAAKDKQVADMKAQAGIQETPASRGPASAPMASPVPAPTAQPVKAPMPAAQPPMGANDPYGTQATMQNFQQGLGEAKAGLANEARAIGAQGAAESRVLEQQVAQKQIAQETYQSHYEALDNERQAFMRDIQNQHIDPKHYMNSMDTGKRVMTGIGLILGGIGGALTHQENPVLKMLNSQIDRDIHAQTAELGKKENLMNANMRQFGNIRDATEMTRMMQQDVISMQLKKAAADAMDPLAKSRALQAAGKIDMDTAQMQGQMAMRKTMLSGVNNGTVEPSRIVNFLIPEGQRGAANKELQDAQTLVSNRDAALAAFDKASKINTMGNKMMSPIQTSRQVNALVEPIVAEISKSTAGRFTEQDADMLRSLYSKAGSNAETNKIQRAALNNLVSKHLQGNNFPILNTYGISPENWGRYGQGGQTRIPESAPVIKK